MVALGDLGVTVLPASAAGLENYAPGFPHNKAIHKARAITNCSRGMEKAISRMEAIKWLIDVIRKQVGPELNARHQAA